MEMLVPLAIVLVTIVSLVSLRSSPARAWKVAARQLGLRHSPAGFMAGPELNGVVDGFPVTVDTYADRSSGSAKVHTRFRAFFGDSAHIPWKAPNRSFTPTPLARSDLEAAARIADRQVLRRGLAAQPLSEWLTPSRKFHVLRFLESHENAVIDSTSITWSLPARVLEPRVLRAGVLRTTSLCAKLSHEGRDDDAVKEALSMQRRGQLDVALEEIRKAEDPLRQRTVDVQVLEGEILYAARRYEEAARVLGNAARQSGDDKDLQRLADRAAERPRAGLGTPREARSAALDPLSAIPTSRELFSDARSSLRARTLFEERLEGCRVAWTGVLRSVRAFSSDAVFGNERGSRAILDILELDEPWLGYATVQAIVKFPSAKEAMLKARVGDAITVQGTLIACDPWARSLYVTGGRLPDASA